MFLKMKEMINLEQKFAITFVSLKQSQFLEVRELSDALANFLAVFEHSFQEEEKALRVEPMQQHTAEMGERFLDFLEDYGREYPQFNVFRSFFSKLPLGHYFMVVHGKLEDTAMVMSTFTFLTNYHLERGIPQPVDVKYFTTQGALEHYNMGTFGHQRRRIGAGVAKANRVCRFCGQVGGKNSPFGYLVSFKHKSHSISEALGNQLVVTADECDGCNDRFSMGIEPSLVAFLSVFRSMHGLNGKGGRKTVVGENFVLDPVEGLSIQSDQTHDQLIGKRQLSMVLKMREKFIGQDIYRCLVKFVLSVVDKRILSGFSKTLEWVNGQINALELPKVAIYQGANFFKSEPMLLYYLRKDESSLPCLVGEFHYADLVYVFIVPFASDEMKDFCVKDDFQDFWKIFNVTRSELKWKFRDFSGLKEQSMQINFKLKGMKLGENAFASLQNEKVDLIG
jgi:hypothetical protein